jgi:hypothetical protein
MISMVISNGQEQIRAKGIEKAAPFRWRLVVPMVDPIFLGQETPRIPPRGVFCCSSNSHFSRPPLSEMLPPGMRGATSDCMQRAPEAPIIASLWHNAGSQTPALCWNLLLLSVTHRQADPQSPEFAREQETCVISTPCCACAISTPH